MTVLTTTAGLLRVLVVDICSACEGFFVGNLRLADIRLDLELSEQSVYDDFQMQLTHTCNDGLSGLCIGIRFEGRVLFCQLCKRDTHLFLTRFGLRLDGDFDNRIREVHGFQDNLCLFVAKRIACRRELQTDRRCDITGVNLFDLLTVVCVHLQNTSDSFLLALRGVVNVGTCCQGSGVNSEESEFADKRVSHDLERECRERSLIVSDSLYFFFGRRINTLDRRDIQRRRHIVNHAVKHHLYTLISVSRSAEHRYHAAADGLLSDYVFDFFYSELFSLEELHHQLFVCLCNRFDEFFSPFLCEVSHVSRNFGNFEFLTQLVLINLCVHFY